MVESCGVVLVTVLMGKMVRGDNRGGDGGSYCGNEDEKVTKSRCESLPTALHSSSQLVLASYRSYSCWLVAEHFDTYFTHVILSHDEVKSCLFKVTESGRAQLPSALWPQRSSAACPCRVRCQDNVPIPWVGGPGQRAALSHSRLQFGEGEGTETRDRGSSPDAGPTTHMQCDLL